MSKIILPAGYTPALNLYDTQRAIGTVKRLFADTLVRDAEPAPRLGPPVRRGRLRPERRP